MIDQIVDNTDLVMHGWMDIPNPQRFWTWYKRGGKWDLAAQDLTVTKEDGFWIIVEKKVARWYRNRNRRSRR